MKRLVVFGCSHTFGHGLPDCISDNKLPGYYPSIHAWPAVLAKRGNMSLSNNSMPGCSNFAILDKIINFSYKKTDRVIVLWSYFERDMLFKINGSRLHFRLGDHKGFSILGKDPLDYWGEIHNPIDIRMRTWYHIHHAYWFLTKVVKKFNFLIVSKDDEFFELRPNFIENIELSDIFFDEFLNKFPKAQDNLHGGIDCHKEYAEELYQNFFVDKNV